MTQVNLPRKGATVVLRIAGAQALMRLHRIANPGRRSRMMVGSALVPAITWAAFSAAHTNTRRWLCLRIGGTVRCHILGTGRGTRHFSGGYALSQLLFYFFLPPVLSLMICAHSRITPLKSAYVYQSMVAWGVTWREQATALMESLSGVGSRISPAKRLRFNNRGGPSRHNEAPNRHTEYRGDQMLSGLERSTIDRLLSAAGSCALANALDGQKPIFPIELLSPGRRSDLLLIR